MLLPKIGDKISAYEWRLENEECDGMVEITVTAITEFNEDYNSPLIHVEDWYGLDEHAFYFNAETEVWTSVDI